MRHRIRERADIDYAVTPRSNASWPDHQARTLVTAGLIAWLEPTSVLDPACGDGSLVLTAASLRDIPRADFIDMSAPSIAALEREIDELDRGGRAVTPGDSNYWACAVGDAGVFLDAAAKSGMRWDVVVLTEFLEHVPDPDWILRTARQVATHLVASSPLSVHPHDDDGNPEHLWAFDNEGYHEMLTGAGWIPNVRNNLHFRTYPYAFQIWTAQS